LNRSANVDSSPAYTHYVIRCCQHAFH